MSLARSFRILAGMLGIIATALIAANTLLTGTQPDLSAIQLTQVYTGSLVWLGVVAVLVLCVAVMTRRD